MALTLKNTTPDAPIRLLTASAIFDGHDAAINVIRLLLQNRGAEVIHLGHNRSVDDLVHAAIQEDVDGIALSSYQGGHMAFFRYLVAALKAQHAGDIPIFGGGGGTITSEEAHALEAHGVARIYTAHLGETLGLGGMVDDLLATCRRHRTAPERTLEQTHPPDNTPLNDRQLGRQISVLQQQPATPPCKAKTQAKVIGITGTGGAGKSTLLDELISALLALNNTLRIALLAIDPTRKKHGGALLGDRIRMNIQQHPRLYLRSLATRVANQSIPPSLHALIALLDQQGFDLIMLETAGIGQSDAAIVDVVDTSIYVMTADYGGPSQLEKIEMLDVADWVVLNKSDRMGSEDALQAVQQQWRINHPTLAREPRVIPVYPMVADRFDDPGLATFKRAFAASLGLTSAAGTAPPDNPAANPSIPPHRRHYLAEIAQQGRELQQQQTAQCTQVAAIQACHRCLQQLGDDATTLFDAASHTATDDPAIHQLRAQHQRLCQQLHDRSKTLLAEWPQVCASVSHAQHHKTSLSALSIPLVALPDYDNASDLLAFLYDEHLPGHFPFTAGAFPFHQVAEMPTRMFAGEGTPEDTNRRFFYLLRGQPSIRLSTAFDPITLYGCDPATTPDVAGCIGMSGVSVSCLDDMKKLYSGIDLSDAKTSVSMTINGPAVVILAWFFHTAIDQQIERYCRENGRWRDVQKILKITFEGKTRPHYAGKLPPGHDGLGLGLLGLCGRTIVDNAVYQRIASTTLRNLRGTLQADILKEELAQNECLFSLPFGLKLMADMQAYFIQQHISHFYGVSVSGYHIAEAGANPITQLAFTLANGFTLVEYYLAQGLLIDDFAGQFSFFFSNGMDPEYAVIGRVARRIWARALRYRYAANTHSQKLKYHIQTSGRSLQAQDMALNDIRTTLQALYAINDNCNSLHTNAFDEALTTPTETSVHQALAIQMIIHQELGIAVNQNPLQGAFIIKTLTDRVEAAVYQEFDRLSARGGVLGAIETFYQRHKIQEESLLYEQKKQDGRVPIVGVNTFVAAQDGAADHTRPLVRCSEAQKQRQIVALQQFQHNHAARSAQQLAFLVDAVQRGENSFAALMVVVEDCSLGQITQALLALGGQYRRKM